MTVEKACNEAQKTPAEFASGANPGEARRAFKAELTFADLFAEYGRRRGVKNMILHTTELAPLPGYRLLLPFNNGVRGAVNLSNELDGEVFEPLRDPALFATASRHPVVRTVAWANGADLAPEFLLELMKAQHGEAAA